MIKGKPKILIIALGGTIAMTHSETGGIKPSLDGNDLIATVPGLESVAEIKVKSPFQLPGASLTIAHIVSVSNMITEAAAVGFDGAVVVQGTDTIEETSFVIECIGKGEIPVVVTGAMRGAWAAGADGPANLLASVIVASSNASQDLGVLVVLNETVHSATYVRKGHTHLSSSFTSAPFGPVGYVVEGVFVRNMTPRHVNSISTRPTIPVPSVPSVAIITLSLDDDARLL
jgi:L-asparaginase